jgi:dGTPase
MNWASLYTSQRTGQSGADKTAYDPVRNSFQRDYDRIIFSSSFRRLQNKTQVFPLPGSVFVHNRLTHSLEVSSVGRSIGKAVGERIAAKYPEESKEFNEFYRHELPSVIAAACLAHDIGNPPFGHSGEDAIRTFFEELDVDIRDGIWDALTTNQLKDFEKFEGNSNAFRVLTHNFNEPEQGGYRLTYTTLAAIVKYPCSSTEGFNKETGLISTKKSGFFDSEKEAWANIAESMGIPKVEGHEWVYARHPFVYLTEAADDICYRVIDLEDAHRLHIISFDTFKQMFLPFFADGEEFGSKAYVERKIANINDDNQKVQYIRALWIGLMIQKMADAFMANEEALLAGTLQTDLLSTLEPSDRELIAAINKFSVKHVYNYRSVVEIEIAGFNVIGGLLKEFIKAILNPKKSRSVKLIKLVSAQFPLVLSDDSIYVDIQSIVDFISGMTDLYAIDLYRKITGITIPEIK